MRKLQSDNRRFVTAPHQSQFKTMLTIVLSIAMGMTVSSSLTAMSNEYAREQPPRKLSISLNKEAGCSCPKCPSDLPMAAVVESSETADVVTGNAVEAEAEIAVKKIAYQITSEETTDTLKPGDTNGSVTDTAQESEQKKTSDDASSLYGRFCNATILGEKETWNEHKKVIAYSVFAVTDGEQLPRWVRRGIEVQARTAKKFYPDWVLRFYTVGLPSDYEQELIQYDNVELVRCIRFPAKFRMAIHRFLVVDDPKVRYSLIRDVDSRFTLRELMAVNEWLASPHLFHSMRDHSHHVVPVMAGAFGMKRGLVDTLVPGSSMTALVEESLQQYGNRRIPGGTGDDQSFLRQVVWPMVRRVAMSHDSSPARCQKFSAKECRDYEYGPRSDYEYYFVGAPFKEPGHTSNVTGHICTLNCTVDYSGVLP